MYCMVHIQNLVIIVNSDIFRHIVTYLEPYVTLACSEPCYIENPGICRTKDIFKTLLRHILAYSACYVMLAYCEHIFRILTYLGPEVYSESCLFRHLQAYSIMIVIITLTLFFSFKSYILFNKLKKTKYRIRSKLTVF